MFENAAKKMLKRHRNECLNALDNLDTYKERLDGGATPLQLVRLLAFARNEKEDAYAIDQTGDRPTNTEIRLYVFPDEATSELHVVLIGDKQSQQRDVNEVHDFIRDIKKTREKKS